MVNSGEPRQPEPVRADPDGKGGLIVSGPGVTDNQDGSLSLRGNVSVSNGSLAITEDVIDESGWWGNAADPRPETLQWLSIDMLTGKKICELPSLVAQDPFRRTIGQYETQTAQITVTSKVSPSWLTATRPMSTALIAFRGAPGSEIVSWGGIVLDRQRPYGSNVITVSLATPEYYLKCRYTGAYSTDPNGTGQMTAQNTIVSDLIDQCVSDTDGWAITVTELTSSVNTERFAEYNDYDDKTVYSVLQALSGLKDGPEWTMHWSWDHDTNRITPVLYVGDRIGNAPAAGLSPAVTFDSANLIDAKVTESWQGQDGANDIMATSSGQGLARPEATATVTSFAGRPKVSYRFQPSTSIEDTETLQDHADHALTLLKNGTTTVTLKGSRKGPKLGANWNLGDTIGYDLDGPLFPGGFSGSARAVGYESDDETDSPVLYVPEVA